MKELLEKYFVTIKRFIPEQETRPVVGLDIGTHSCRMVELKRKGNSFELLRWAAEPILHGNLKQAVKAVLAKTSQPTVSPVTAIFGKGTLIRYIEMPKMSFEDIKKSFAFEADKYFPFPPDQIYTDCYVMETKDNKMSVLVAAAKKELIDQRISFLTDLGLQADLITLNSIAVANVCCKLGCFEQAVLPEQKPSLENRPPATAVLDVGEVVSNLTIIVGTQPRFTRDIFIGGQEFTKSIVNALGVTFEEAEKIKCSPQEKAAEVLGACESTILNLLSEVRLSFDYFVTEKNVTMSQLLITGGASMLEGLPDAFSKNLEMPAKQWNPFESVKLAEGVSLEGIQKDAGKLVTALGLALP